MAAATSRSTYDTPLTSDERNAVFSGDRYAASDEALNANRALGAAGQETAESPAISKVVISAKRLTWFEKAWSLVQEVGGAIADFASNMASSSPGTYGTSSSAGYFYIPREVQKARNDRVSGIAPGSPPNLWRQGANGLASSVATLAFGGSGVRPDEFVTWQAKNPNVVSRWDGRPAVQISVDLFEGKWARTIGTAEGSRDELKNILSLGFRPLGHGLGDFAGGVRVATGSDFSREQRAQAAFDAGANSLAVAAATALVVSPAIKFGNRLETPGNPSAYSVAFETKLDPVDFGRSRKVHFNRSNAALDDALQADAEFAKLMDDLIPGVQPAVSSVGTRKTPAGWTWEHASTSTATGQAGVMRLVPTEQHTPGSLWWRILHPDHGARGGYSEWAIPAGAPRN